MSGVRSRVRWRDVWSIVIGAGLGLCVSMPSIAQSIQTYAGGGPIGDGRPATEANLVSPFAVAFDSDGNLYIADRLSHMIRKVDSSGTISTVAGGGTNRLLDGGPATEAELFRPSGVAVDSNGNLYFTEASNARVRRVEAATGIITTVAGGGIDRSDGIPATSARLVWPVGVAIAPDGNLFFADEFDQRVRKVDLESGLLTTVAGTGNGGFSGDGGPATLAELNQPFHIAFDDNGDLIIADSENRRVRRVPADSELIETVFSDDDEAVYGVEVDGNILYMAIGEHRVVSLNLETQEEALVAGASRGFSGDGGPATEAKLDHPVGLVVAPSGDLVICDRFNNRVRRVLRETMFIETIAGSGLVGDGGPATAAQILLPQNIAVTSEGDLIIAELSGERIRRVSAESRIVTTIAGDGVREYLGDGGLAKDARVNDPRTVAVDSLGNIYIGTFESAIGGGSRVRKIDFETGVISTIAGGGESLDDGIPATQAFITNPWGIAVDDSQNVYFPSGEVVRRVDADGIITTFAGGGDPPDELGDGGPATEARLRSPSGLAFDLDGDLYVSDFDDHRIRVITLPDGIISTVAGTGVRGNSGDGGPATETNLNRPADIDFDPVGNLFFAERGGLSRIRRVDVATGLISTVAGGASNRYSGDGGPATKAGIFTIRGIAIDASGNLFESEDSNRIRVIFACTDVEPAMLISPVNGETDVPTAPALEWGPSRGAFRYDVLLNKEGEAGFTAASDLTTTAFTPQNLEEGATYFWRVRAKGDPFCEPVRESLSEVRAFVVIPPCEAPPPAVLAAPADGAVIEDFTTTLTWDAVQRVGSYDVYLGTSLPPPLVRSTTGTSFTTPRLVPGNTYYWSVTAHASCDPALVTPSTIRSFFLAGPCNPAGEFDLTEPADGAGNIATKTTLRWTASENATSYDLFLGTTNPPAIFLPRMVGTAVTIEGLDPARTYWWRVKANIACDDGKSRPSPVQSFTTRDDCKRPGGSTITFTPPGAVGTGQTYAITWSAAPDLDPGGTYVVERSLDADFSTILDAQELTSTSATFIAETPGAHYHRVHSIARCNRSLTGPRSAVESVTVVAESANIVFTVEPSAVVSRLGGNLEDLETRFTIENISSSSVQAIIGRTEIESVPFFQVFDPLGADSSIVTLQPREPKTFALKFSGPPNDVEAAYQGLVFLSVADSPVIPYAFVNLKVGDRSGAIPEFRISGTSSEYAFFPGLDGDDRDRPPITVEIHNPGTTPMELGAEVGPEVWLEPEPGWNGTPIPPGATREVKLTTRRNRALNGSALPRYTYFTVRTRAGEAARLLVQDNAASATTSGRSAPLEPNVRSLIVPEVVSETRGGVPLVSKVRLTNLGSDPVQAELVYTPSGTDGFSGSVKRSVIVVPPNDVATMTDPLVQVFGLARPSVGQIEVRAAEEKLGLLSVDSTVVSGDRADASFVRIPTLQRNDGARAGAPHQIAGVTSDAGRTTRLVLAETSGSDGATLALSLYDASGAAVGSSSISVERYGHVRIDDLVTSLGGSRPFADGRVTLAVTDGGGSVAGLAKVESADGSHASVLVSEPLPEGVSSKRIAWSNRSPRNGVTKTLVAPYVVSGDVEGTGVEYATVMGFQSPGGIPVELTARLVTSGQTLEKTFVVPAGAIIRHRNVISDLFGIVGPANGSVVVISDPRGRVYGRIEAGGIPAGTIDLISSASELVSMAGSARPLYVDGIEQSTDPERGSRWNLYVREIAGASGEVTVRLYEAGNRTHPIAIRDFSIAPNERLELETLFGAMGLDSETRRKDRTNVLCVVTPKSGSAQIAAVAVEIDNVTGIATPHTLQPASGLSPSGVTTGLVRVVDFPSSGNRQRPVNRPTGD